MNITFEELMTLLKWLGGIFVVVLAAGKHLLSSFINQSNKQIAEVKTNQTQISLSNSATTNSLIETIKAVLREMKSERERQLRTIADLDARMRGFEVMLKDSVNEFRSSTALLTQNQLHFTRLIQAISKSTVKQISDDLVRVEERRKKGDE